MFEEVRYEPYKQVDFTMTNSGLTISAPWLSIEVDVDEEKKVGLSQVIDRLGSRINLKDDQETQDFLHFFSGYPLVHAYPRKYSKKDAAPYASSAPELISAAGPRQFLEAINPFYDISPSIAFAYFPDTWEWDVSKITADSGIPNTRLYDPYSVYTAIRAKRLQYQIEQSSFSQSLLSRLEKLRELNEAAFFDAMATILAQQYYVTRECCSCLDLAIHHHKHIDQQIRAYKGEELDHDKLILSSIRELSNQATGDFFFAPEVKLEIEVIKYASEACALGFSALVSIMEGTVYPESDPVGDILRKSSKPESHAGVELHFQINRRGNHTAIPEQFVRNLPPVTKETVETATRLAEVTSRLDCGLARTMLSRIEDFL